MNFLSLTTNRTGHLTRAVSRLKQSDSAPRRGQAEKENGLDLPDDSAAALRRAMSRRTAGEPPCLARGAGKNQVPLQKNVDSKNCGPYILSLKGGDKRHG
jgi:hypothetical protein